MEQISGKSVYGGIAIGTIKVFQKKESKIERSQVADCEAEKKRYLDAKEVAISQLKLLYDKALLEVGEANAMIFEVHQMMLEDEDYQESIQFMMEEQKVNAEYAIAVTSDNFQAMFSSMEDAYMQARAADIKDISERLIGILKKEGAEFLTLEEPVILLAEDLAPSETVSFDKDKLLAFVTRQGSSNSHTAILARTMGIPALVQTKVDSLHDYDGKRCIVDGFSGTLIIDPDEATLLEKQRIQKRALEEKLLLQEMKGKEDITLDRKSIKLFANIGSIQDVAAVHVNDARGIGLFRSEFLYLESKDFPTEEEQFRAYKTVAENMAGKPVIIRTLDIGADKKVDYFHLDAEENPALGYRAIRICLTQKELFKTQLRALYRASFYGNLSIMFPMITSVSEVKQIKEIVDEVRAELRTLEIPYREVSLGIMIETPAAALISDALAREVDFFSIGTNDLTQYTLAIDRQNAKLDSFYQPHHEAVLKLIEMTVQNAHQNGIWAGICGELASDLELTERFLAMGVDELSVSPTMILKIRKKIRESRVSLS
ncbi:MAG: phosphoenolpyruvate-protein phosphotransferase system enzyme [Clostridiales bacterium]|nr:phosphoenolpyruvate-protein phosphotransferase system enzyme [Clostridiales bacterium]